MPKAQVEFYLEILKETDFQDLPEDVLRFLRLYLDCRNDEGRAVVLRQEAGRLMGQRGI